MIYSLNDPRDGRVRYVGRAARPDRRFATHLARPHSPALRAWAAELRDLGLRPVLNILGDGIEAEWIERLRPDLNGRPGARKDEAAIIALARSNPYTVRYNDEENAEVMEAAAAKALETGSWIRMVSVEAARKQKKGAN